MKYFLLIIFLLTINSINAQSNIELINNYEKKAAELEKDGNYFEAINYYYTISQMDTFRNGENAIKKIEILIPKCRELFYQEIKGKWKLKKKFDLDYYSNIKFTKFIKIENNTITFYENSKNMVSQINLENQPFSYNMFAGFPSLKLGKEIWSFSVRKVNGQKRLCLRKHVDKNGNLIGLLDDRGIIINKRKREKALKQEIDIYYIKK
ncbi:hypothetical protein [Chryseobacterium sp. R2A-55]|uniref:hypothetical protein n=1 Tax=Chryseobacterium sp. R2A-55 TaxID=2744445 RepID=UPI001F334815|nr:hypothetical protein [Chryseobacterium sp. R2A-55]